MARCFSTVRCGSWSSKRQDNTLWVTLRPSLSVHGRLEHRSETCTCSVALKLDPRTESSNEMDDFLRRKDIDAFRLNPTGFLDFPSRVDEDYKEQVPMVRVKLSVEYRAHSRQILCIGGSQVPFGWSFISIARVPMTWNTGDKWTAEVELPAGQRVEYKYVILEEQDWTKQINENAEGVVTLTYRSGDESGKPPDVQTIQKRMAIVAWQPGNNRVLKVPTEAEIRRLQPGQSVARTPSRPREQYGGGEARRYRGPEPQEDTYETLTLDDDGRPVLLRTDSWQ